MNDQPTPEQRRRLCRILFRTDLTHEGKLRRVCALFYPTLDEWRAGIEQNREALRRDFETIERNRRRFAN